MVRVSRITTAEKALPRISAGMSICPIWRSGSSVKGVSFTSGDHPHQIDGKTMTRVPTQKPGSARARMANERVT